MSLAKHCMIVTAMLLSEWCKSRIWNGKALHVQPTFDVSLPPGSFVVRERTTAEKRERDRELARKKQQEAEQELQWSKKRKVIDAIMDLKPGDDFEEAMPPAVCPP